MKLKGPDNCGGLFHDGREYLPDGDGCIEVEDVGALEVAFSHGYAAVPEQPPEQPAEAKPRGKKAPTAE